MTRAPFFAAALVSLSAVAPAAADVAPRKPPEDCSIEKLCKDDGQACPSLGGIVDENCAAGMAQRGMVQKCIQGASVGKAIYCPGAPAAKKGCGKSAVAPSGGHGEGTLALGFAVTGLVVAGLRRARSRRSPKR